MIYKVFTKGNVREITAVVDEKYFDTVVELNGKVIEYPIVVGEDMKTFKFYFVVEGDKCLVKFERHQFSTSLRIIETIIKVARVHLEKIYEVKK